LNIPVALLLAGFCLAVATSNTKAASNSIASSDKPPSPVFERCIIGDGAATQVAECTTLEVPLDPDNLPAGNLALAIARIPATGTARGDAFTLLAGGPGQSAIQSWPSISFAFRHIARDHDVILIDQRGTGDSSPLDCPASSESLTLQLDLDADALSDAANACLKGFDADVRLFTTSIAVHDLESVRRQLGIPAWNIYGVSYGTRVAQHYVRRYPHAVRTLILDAVVPPSAVLGPEIAPLAQRALDNIFERCAASTDCQQRFPDIAHDTAELLASLKKLPQSVTYEDISTGQLRTIAFSDQHLALTLRLMSYSSQTAALLPSMLHEAIINNNFAPLARQADLQASSLDQSLATGMHHSVVCTEDVPFINWQTDPAKSAETYLGADLLDALKATCSIWPAGRLDADFHEALVSNTPTLILSGANDPITPPEYGNKAAESLDNVRHIINPHRGHMQAPYGCMPALMAEFITDANPEGLSLECLERLGVSPFFVDANGPLP